MWLSEVKKKKGDILRSKLTNRELSRIEVVEIPYNIRDVCPYVY